MQSHLEALSKLWISPSQPTREPGHQHQVGGAGDGKQLGGPWISPSAIARRAGIDTGASAIGPLPSSGAALNRRSPRRVGFRCLLSGPPRAPSL